MKTRSLFDEIVVDNFAGGGGASTGIEAAIGRNVDIAINHDPAAIAMHNANHPETEHYCESVWDIDPVTACGGRKVALAWFSPDCFIKGTMILTRDGYKPIEEIQVGDYVLTHLQRWRRVTETSQADRETMFIKGLGNCGMICSKEHPFYIKKRKNVWNNNIRQYRSQYSKAEWLKAQELDTNSYWSTPTHIPAFEPPKMVKKNNKERVLPVDERLMWLAGRYVGDGWTRLTESRAEIVIVCGDKEIEYLREKLNMWPRSGIRAKDGELNWNFRKVRTGGQFTANSRALVRWLRDNFGYKALYKKIPGWLYGAGQGPVEAFLDGYVGADGWNGCTVALKNIVEVNTISKGLAYGILQMATILGYSAGIYCNEKPNDVIEGRKVFAKKVYKVRWRELIDKDHKQTFTESELLWQPIRKIKKLNKVEKVYNIGVEEDESYVAEGVIVHNCKHFSKAKGGKPVEKSIRGLAWIAVRWAKKVRPRIIMLENVEEFKSWGPLTKENKPDPRFKGRTFGRFVHALKRYGYHVDWRELRACDYGAPTIRKRLFLIARCDGLPIVWPEPTHGDPKRLDVQRGLLKPWRTAAGIIDWSLPCPSIFDRKKPLVENTMRRIARGLKKFVIDNAEPFIVQINHSGDCFRGQAMSEPLSTVTAKHGYGLVTPYLIQYHSEQSVKDVRGQMVDQPLMTTDASNRYGLVTSFLIKHYGGGYTGAGTELNDPVHTVTTVDHNALVMAFMMHYYGTSTGSGADQPLGTITAIGQHIAAVQAFLIKYYGRQGDGQSLADPLHTFTSHDRFGLVMVHVKGEPYIIVDIGMRMLTPRELFNAQGFPEDYIIEQDYKDRVYPKSAQVARCGNAVPPPFAEALVRANLPELCQAREAKVG